MTPPTDVGGSLILSSAGWASVVSLGLDRGDAAVGGSCENESTPSNLLGEGPQSGQSKSPSGLSTRTGTMHVTFQCPSCRLPQHSAELHAEGGELRCLCGWKKPLTADDVTGDSLNRCLVCGTVDLWRNKEFPPIIQVFFVAVGTITVGIAAYFRFLVVAPLIILALACLNHVLYQRMREVLICYRCQSRHGKVSLKGRMAYDHKLGEHYRQ